MFACLVVNNEVTAATSVNENIVSWSSDTEVYYQQPTKNEFVDTFVSDLAFTVKPLSYMDVFVIDAMTDGRAGG